MGGDSGGSGGEDPTVNGSETAKNARDGGDAVEAEENVSGGVEPFTEGTAELPWTVTRGPSSDEKERNGRRGTGGGGTEEEGMEGGQ